MPDRAECADCTLSPVLAPLCHATLRSQRGARTGLTVHYADRVLFMFLHLQ